MNMKDFENKEPTIILDILGKLIEEEREQNNLSALEKLINELTNLIDDPKFNLREKAVLHYFIANTWSYIQRIKLPKDEFPLETIELENEIIHLRKAYNLISKTDDSFNKSQILTNLGNLFSHIGRFSESQDFFNECLELDKDFGMAMGNRGFGLYYYARVVFEPVHQFIFLQHARKDLLNATNSSDVYIEAKYDFADIINGIEKVYPINELNNFKNYGDFYKNLNEDEKDYRMWCTKNKLYINPLNDILQDSVVAQDFMFIPTMTLKSNYKLFYHSMFNQLKQEYITARYLYYEGTTNKSPHFADRDVLLMDTLDYPVYSISSEKVKMAFRMSYSLFDKIAYFINIYLDLGHDKNRVTFRTVWYNKLDKKKGINNKLLSTKNWAMRGLFWLSKDFYEINLGDSIEPESKEIALIRNFIEHKSFKIVDFADYDWREKTDTFEINRNLFYDKTLKLLKLSRSALMYLSFLIYDEETKNNLTNSVEFNPAIDFTAIEDNHKI